MSYQLDPTKRVDLKHLNDDKLFYSQMDLDIKTFSALDCHLRTLFIPEIASLCYQYSVPVSYYDLKVIEEKIEIRPCTYETRPILILDNSGESFEGSFALKYTYYRDIGLGSFFKLSIRTTIPLVYSSNTSTMPTAHPLIFFRWNHTKPVYQYDIMLFGHPIIRAMIEVIRTKPSFYPSVGASFSYTDVRYLLAFAEMANRSYPTLPIITIPKPLLVDSILYDDLAERNHDIKTTLIDSSYEVDIRLKGAKEYQRVKMRFLVFPSHYGEHELYRFYSFCNLPIYDVGHQYELSPCKYEPKRYAARPGTHMFTNVVFASEEDLTVLKMLALPNKDLMRGVPSHIHPTEWRARLYEYYQNRFCGGSLYLM